MERRKRCRGANYTSKEINILLNIIIQFKHIVENKRTDAVACKEKENAWKKIANIFNSCSPSGVYRSAGSLKKAFDNKKKAMRKNVAAKKLFITKTGENSVQLSTDLNDDLTLSILNIKKKLELNELNNRTDTDAHDINHHIFLDEPEIYESKIDKELKQVEDESNTLIKTEESSDFEIQVNSTDEPDENISQVTVRSLSNKTHRNFQRTNNTYPFSRRKLGVSAFRSGNRSEEYSELIKIKIECAKLQMAILEEEKEYKRIESELRQKSLQLDISLKEIQLENLKNGN